MAGSKPGAGASTVAATGGVERVEIVTRSEARRGYTPEEKARLLTEGKRSHAALLCVSAATRPFLPARSLVER